METKTKVRVEKSERENEKKECWSENQRQKKRDKAIQIARNMVKEHTKYDYQG